jgi:hypothetical protein
VAREQLHRQDFLSFIFLGIAPFFYFVQMCGEAFFLRAYPFGHAVLQVLLLLFVVHVLEDPVVLDLGVGRQMLLHEDQGMHLPEE